MDFMEIFITECPTETVNGERYIIMAKNADSWEFTIYNSDDEMIHRSAGVMTGNEAIVWDGNGVPSGQYHCSLVLKNSYGRRLVHNYHLMVMELYVGPIMARHPSDSTELPPESIKFFPNPTDGPLITTTDSKAEAIFIHELTGRSVEGWQIDAIGEDFFTLDVSTLPSGTYILTFRTTSGIQSARFIRK